MITCPQCRRGALLVHESGTGLVCMVCDYLSLDGGVIDLPAVLAEPHDDDPKFVEELYDAMTEPMEAE